MKCVRIWPTGELAWVEPVSEGVPGGAALVRRVQRQPEGEPSGWIIPKWIDNHCHILPSGLFLQMVNLRSASTPDQVLQSIADRVRVTEPGQWVRAAYYDQTKFDDGRHLTRHQLDAVSAEHPILIRHVNGHASVANSLALQIAGVDASTPDPKGGAFDRDSSGDLTGVLLETAHEWVSAKVPNPDRQTMKEAILAAIDQMRADTLCGATDMQTGRYHLEDELWAYEQAARQAGFPIRLFVQWSCIFGPKGIGPAALLERSRDLDPRYLRIAGIKIFADGAIGSRTAAIYGQYAGSTGTEDEGQLIYSPEKLNEMVRAVDEAGFSVAIHTIGDRGTDLVMDALAQTEDPTRHRIEHAMMLSDAQIERMAALGSHVTMQPEFLLQFGHSYRRNLGPDRASKLFRFKSVLQAGLRLSLSSDRPIVEGHPLDAFIGATQRPKNFDPEESLTPQEAILGLTTYAHWADGEPPETEESNHSQTQFQLFESLPARFEKILEPFP